MATNGQKNTNTEYDSYFWVKWSQNGNQDITNNRTPIAWSCGVYCGHSFYSNAIKMSPFSINGSQVYGGGTYSNFSKGNHTIASGTMWIKHNDDGKKEFSISSFTGWLYSDHNYSASESKYTLTTIPRQATLTSAPDFTDEANPTIKYSNLAGNSVTKLQACISLTTETDDIAYRDISKTGTSYTFNLTEAEREILRNATKTSNTRDVTFFIKTVINGTTYYSTLKKKLSIVNANPTFTESQISYADTSVVKDITKNPQHIVQNQSNLKVTFEDASAKKGASISKYDITVNGVTKSVTASGTVDFGKLNVSANTEVSIKVTDSRGNTATAKKTITVLPWAKPVFTVSLERLNNYEDETHLMVDASVSSVNGKNTLDISYQYKESGAEYDNIIYHIENKTEYTIVCDKNKAYIFSITVADAFDSVTTEFALSKGKFPLFIETRRNAVGINDFPAEGEALRVVGGVANFVNGIKIGDYLPDLVIEQGVTADGVWIYRKWASGVAECWGTLGSDKEWTSGDSIFGSSTIAYSSRQADFPKIFMNTPTIFATANDTGTGVASAENEGSTKDICKVTIYGTSTAIGSVSVYAIGKWK